MFACPIHSVLSGYIAQNVRYGNDLLAFPTKERKKERKKEMFAFVTLPTEWLKLYLQEACLLNG
jgi:hypothetical protein